MSMWRFLSKYHEEIERMKSAATTMEELVVCVNLFIAYGEKATSEKFCISKRAVSGLKACPTGCCIQALATRIQTADMLLPTATIQVEKR